MSIRSGRASLLFFSKAFSGFAVLFFLLSLSFVLQAADKPVTEKVVSEKVADTKIPADKEKFHLYLLIGQSNMAGRAPLVGVDKEPIRNVFLLNGSDEWQQAMAPLNLYSSVRKGAKMQKLNPGVTFSRKMVEADADIRIGLVVNAKGGTKIELWNSRDQKFYQEALRRIRIAMKDGTLKGILWHQGEANCKDPKYMEKITQLINFLREDLEMPDLPFVAGQINPQNPAPETFNKIILTLPEHVKNTAVASTEGLTAQDNWHFDTESMRKLGERYAQKMLEVQNKDNVKK